VLSQYACRRDAAIAATGIPSAAETTIGLQTRYDRIDVGLFNTAQRSILSVVRDDTVDEASTGVYGQNSCGKS
jgi:hypothetical protein